jgi:hypothetical protein
MRLLGGVGNSEDGKIGDGSFRGGVRPSLLLSVCPSVRLSVLAPWRKDGEKSGLGWRKEKMGGQESGLSRAGAGASREVENLCRQEQVPGGAEAGKFAKGSLVQSVNELTQP